MESANAWILSYDVDGRDRSAAVRVCQLIYGRRNITTEERRPKRYDQPGFIHRPGVVWVGQSVLILPGKDAFELRDRLEAIGASVGLGRLVINRVELDKFRRRRRGRRRGSVNMLTVAEPTSGRMNV